MGQMIGVRPAELQNVKQDFANLQISINNLKICRPEPDNDQITVNLIFLNSRKPRIAEFIPKCN